MDDVTSPSTRPTPEQLREWLAADARALVAAASGSPTSPVPTCPGWSARDVVDHTAEVYAHKIAVMRLGRRPQEGEWPWAPNDETVFAWFDERLAELLAEFEQRDAADQAWTWHPGDQSVGFWLHRMVHETAIHRVDAQLAAGVPLTPHPLALAIDGVGEVLGPFLAGDDVMSAPEGRDGQAGSLLVAPAGGAGGWLVSLPDDGHDVTWVADVGALGHVEGLGEAAAEARLSGAAGDLYRSLWNRPTEGAVERAGSPAVLRRLDARLAIATQ